MPETWKKVVIPGPGDDLLAAFRHAFDTAGVVIPVASLAQARLVLTQAEQAGQAPTPARPAYFDIQGLMYRSDGSKQPVSGVWQLGLVNATVPLRRHGADGGRYTMAARTRTSILAIPLPVAPYARELVIHGSLYGRVITGTVNLSLQCGDDVVLARFETGAGSDSTVTAMLATHVPAGAQRTVSLGVAGDLPSGQSTIQTARNRLLNSLVVMPFPADATE